MTVEVRDLDGGSTYSLGFDHLMIGTGGRPIRPPLPGIDLPFIHGVQTLDDAAELLAAAEHDPGRVVVVGGGYIGLEIAEAFLHRGCTSTVIDVAAVSAVAARRRARCSSLPMRWSATASSSASARRCIGFEPGMVRTNDGDVPADLVVLGHRRRAELRPGRRRGDRARGQGLDPGRRSPGDLRRRDLGGR